MANRIEGLGGSGVRYRTIVADPPWAYRTARITTTGKQRRAEAVGHYATMAAEEVAALPVSEMVEDDAHLYLWVTNPILPQAFQVVKAWGFEYRTIITWEKQGALGMGFSFRNQTEHVLFGVRGTLPIPANKRERTIFAAPKGRHSEKPDCFMDMVERVSPAPRLEMFARRSRLSGWDYWGDQSLGTAELVA